MIREVSRWKTGWIKVIMLTLILSMCFSISALAGSRKLFEIEMNDGKKTQIIPVYEYKDAQGNVTTAPKKAYRKLMIHEKAETISLKATNKTKYYKKYYKCLYLKKSVPAQKQMEVKYALKPREGKKIRGYLMFEQPQIPSIEAMEITVPEEGLTPDGKEKAQIKFEVHSEQKVPVIIKITNSKGKLVYRKDLDPVSNVRITTKWDGTAGSTNKAGLKEDDPVPAGTYKVTVYVKYQGAYTSKYIKQYQKMTVLDAEEPADTVIPVMDTDWQVILTGDDTLDYVAEQICQQLLKPGMSQVERAKALFQWENSVMTYHSGAPDVDSLTPLMDITSTKAKKRIAAYAAEVKKQKASGKATVDNSDNYWGDFDALDQKIYWTQVGMVYHIGDCLIMSMVYETLCRHAGIEAHIVENAHEAGHHFWNVVGIKTTAGVRYYYADVNVGSDYFLRGTDYIYQNSQHAAVLKNDKRYLIANKVSRSDCPQR